MQNFHFNAHGVCMDPETTLEINAGGFYISVSCASYIEASKVEYWSSGYEYNFGYAGGGSKPSISNIYQSKEEAVSKGVSRVYNYVQSILKDKSSCKTTKHHKAAEEIISKLRVFANFHNIRLVSPLDYSQAEGNQLSLFAA
ncbi:MAG: hypothetical protein H7329_10685 [Opitutaceae bacterium]|nr:hypothetical protein [Cytophagales bacterium]